jgi:hypothetical protein
MRNGLTVLLLATGLATVACGVTQSDPDAALIDAASIDAPDAGDDGGVDAPDASIDAPPAPPSASDLTAGGGFTSSAGHRLHVRIAAPQPLGGAQSAGHHVTTGPGALPWPTP